MHKSELDATYRSLYVRILQQVSGMVAGMAHLYILLPQLGGARVTTGVEA